MSGAFPRIGLGGAGIGNLYSSISDSEAEAAVLAALASGFGLIDTAPYYGHGLSEVRIGAALKMWRGPRPLLSSKVGRVLDPAKPGEEGAFGFAKPMPFRPRFDYSRDGVRRSLDDTLARLGVERLDIALVHDIDEIHHGARYAEIIRQVIDETLPALQAARDAGRIGQIGLGINLWEAGVAVLEHAPLDVILIAGRYTLLEQPAQPLLDLCLARNVRVLAAGVFNSGLLATPPSDQSPYNYEKAPPAIVARAAALWRACARHGIAPQAAALQFPLTHPAISTVLVGARSAEEVNQAKAWFEIDISPDFWRALKDEGYLQSGSEERS